MSKNQYFERLSMFADVRQRAIVTLSRRKQGPRERQIFQWLRFSGESIAAHFSKISPTRGDPNHAVRVLCAACYPQKSDRLERVIAF
jgi:hypothetical protein